MRKFLCIALAAFLYPLSISAASARARLCQELLELAGDGVFLEPLAGESTLAGARVIGFGDRHNDPRWVEAAKHVIAKYAEDGDVVLLEGLTAGQEVPPESCLLTDTLSARVRVIGFDRMDALDRSTLLIREFIDEQAKPAPNPLEIRRIQRQLFDETKTRNLSLAEELLKHLDAPERPRVFIFSGEKHLSPEDSPMSFGLSTHRVPFVFLKPPGENPDASDEELREYFEQHLRPHLGS